MTSMHPTLIKELAETVVADLRRKRDASRPPKVTERVADQHIERVINVRIPDTQIPDALVDDLLDLYIDWRTESAAVHAAYERFSNASRSERQLAFAAYTAALDREGSAAGDYEAQIRRILERDGAACGAPSAALAHARHRGDDHG